MLKHLAPVFALSLFAVACNREVAPSDEEAPVTTPESTKPTGKDDSARSTTSKTDSASVSVPDLPGGADPLPASNPGEWAWMGPDEFGHVPECMDGSKTGLGISRSPNGSKKVLVFMMGGGACFDGQTCAIADHALSADHADSADFDEFKVGAGAQTVMNRTNDANPFKDWNYVYVPYCSGDVFSGANTSGFDNRPQLGYKNVSAYLPRLKATFKDAEQFVLSGTSAGGYGAAYNYVQVQKAFNWLDITVVDDSGPPLSPTFSPTCLQEKWKNTWHMDQTSPIEGTFPIGIDPKSGVAGGGLLELVQDVVSAHPKSKFAFISHEGDLVMRYFHGIGHSFNCSLPGLIGADDFATGLREVRDKMKGDNFLTYYGPGSGHQYFMKDADLFETTVDGVTLAQWLDQIVNDKDASHRLPAEFCLARMNE